MTRNEKRRKQFIAGLSGDYEYCCIVSGKKTFENGEKQRGGKMSITLNFNDLTGMVGHIAGIRRWSKKLNEAKKLLKHPKEWGTEHQISFTDDGKLLFTYIIYGKGRAGGQTRDIYYINEVNGFELHSPGTFDHTTSNGKRIKGVVHIRKIQNKEDFIWCPKKKM